MPRYSQTSEDHLATCHADLQTLFNVVVQRFDNTVIVGHRGEKEQNEAYATGKSQLKWPHGNHNASPSLAVDAVPYPIDWNDRERMCLFAGYVIATADQLLEQGKISHRIRWGGDWNRDTEVKDNSFDYLAHFELVAP